VSGLLFRPDAVGAGNRQRFVMPSSKHHVEIFAKLDAQGREGRWDSIVVSLMEASERKRQQDKEYKRSGVRQPAVVQRVYPAAENYVFKFSLMGGDIV
jgi:hypothetical protein